MSTVEHHATVDRGLKMKIKRKNVEKGKKDQNKTDTSKLDIKAQGETSQSANGMLADKTSKLSLFSDKEKSPKSKPGLTKKDKGKGATKGDIAASSGSNINGLDSLFTQGNMEPKVGELPANKKECVPDPYEFNAKVEDDITMPIKKLKMEPKDIKVETPGPSSQAGQSSTTTQSVATDTSDVAVVTEPECLGPCEPGTQVHLDGIVWHESENGVLVVNVTWRGKTYVGTLLDATRHDWAPPRLNCDSPSCDFESRTPKGRGKRRGASNTPVNDTRTLRKGRRGSSQQTFTAPPSPARSDIVTGGLKRKGRPQDIDLSSSLDQRMSKRSRSASQLPTPTEEKLPTDAQGYLECPEANCNKKYKNANGLKYHQSHAHSGSNSNTSCDDTKDVDMEDIPLSIVKNAVRKEKEVKRDLASNSKKDNAKENNQNSDKNEKSREISASSSGRKSEKDEKETSSDKDANTSSRNEAKCDSNSSSKKKEKESANNTPSKVPVSHSIPVPNSSKANVSQTTVSKSDQSINGSASSSQTSVSNSNSVQVSSQITSSSTVSVPSTAASTLSSTIVSSIAQPEAFKSDNKLVDIKPKLTLDARVTKANRPIVPAPTPVLASVQVTHSNLSPVMSHAQMSPQLKPIQPKPTIMGEPQNINPALADLNKDRKKLQKKRPKDGTQAGNNRLDQPTIKIERTGVIKTNPLPNKHSENISGNKDSPRHASDIRSQNSGAHLTPKGTDNHSRMNQNPHLLKVSSPIQASTPEHHKNPVNDDVQSPAYSDISDANESASPAAPIENSPQKQKDDVNKKGDKAESVAPPQGENAAVPPQHYGAMYYYGQQQQYMANMSPGQKSNSSTSSSVAPSPGQGPNPVNKDTKRQGSEEKKITQEEPSKMGDKKPDERDINRPKMIPRPGSGPPPSNLSPQQMHEYQMQQNHWYQQQMYHNMQSLPRHMQYQYMAANGWYPPSMDPAYMQHMMDEQQRRAAQGEAGRNDREPGSGGPESQGQPQGSKHGELNRSMDRSMDNGKGGSGAPGAPAQRKDDHPSHLKSAMPTSSQNPSHERLDNNKSSESDKMKEQAHKDKQNENLQFLKENRDMKTEMDKKQEFERFRQAEEMRRYKMYQEQKMIEERKKNDLSRKGETRPESLVSKAPGTKPIVDHNVNSRSVMNVPRSMEDVHRDVGGISIKREIGVGVVEAKGKDIRDSHSRESSVSKYPDTSKQGEEKSKTPISDKHRPEAPGRNPDPLKHRPGGSSSKSGSPSTSVTSSVPGSSSGYQSFVNNYGYMQNSPQFMGVDPAHPLYRSHNVNPALVSGYPAQYIHPSQVNYRPGMDDIDKEKANAQKLAPSSDSDLKKGDSGGTRAPFYSNTHKIHELSEKARPRSRNTSPCPPKSADPAVSASYDMRTNSPPTQRHVHTHHHTHVLQSGIQPGPMPPASGLPVYDPYGAMLLGQSQSPHPFPPK